jgi:amidase
VHPDCVAAAEDAARLLESLGHVVETSYPAVLDDPEVGPPWTTVVSSCIARDLDYWSARTGKKITRDDVEPLTWAMAEIGRIFSAREYIAALEFLQAHRAQVTRWWAQGFDLLLTPTLAAPPPLLGTFVSTPDDPLGNTPLQTAFVTFTSPFNMTGQPAISVPLQWNPAGLPIGVQLVAAYGREDLLIRVASQLEQARPWAGRRPPLHA